MTLDIVLRNEFGWPTHPNVPHADTDQGMVAHYDGSNQGLAHKVHSACIAYWVRTRGMHIESRGWNDIGYAYGICPHGFIFEGRGYGYEQAAQKSDKPGGIPHGNTRWISCTWMSGPTEVPTTVQLAAWHRLRAWLTTDKGLGSAVRGHRDFSQTDCPGSILYAWTKNGTLTSQPLEVDDMELSVLRKGDVSFDMKTARADLFARGYVPVTLVPDLLLRSWLENMTFDEQFEVLIKDFQSRRDLVPDGIIGPLTWSKLRRQ